MPWAKTTNGEGGGVVELVPSLEALPRTGREIVNHERKSPNIPRTYRTTYFLNNKRNILYILL